MQYLRVRGSDYFSLESKSKAQKVTQVSEQEKENKAQTQTISGKSNQLEANPSQTRDQLEHFYSKIFTHLAVTSNCNKVTSKPLLRQTEINKRMRCILFDWLLQLHQKYNLKRRTMFLCSNIFDRYLEKVFVPRKSLQLVGLASLLIASKFEDIHPPEIKDLCSLCDNAYSKESLLAIEADMLYRLDFNLVIVSLIDAAESLTLSFGIKAKKVQIYLSIFLDLLVFYQHIDRFGTFAVAAIAIQQAHVIAGLPTPPVIVSLIPDSQTCEKIKNVLKKILLYQHVDNLKFLAEKYEEVFYSVERFLDW